ncbi:uncharacterized protein YhaN [Aquisalibacillus elongatus]|uniref:Uncharacterized protein YhaN n=1 Tax=Aquisalibacillus elongatus TaxID=485577 RepID=A0A3N5AYV2_9BACI|nr:uncharacterized protein YhaN [Aquisalibacillus elongatus]
MDLVSFGKWNQKKLHLTNGLNTFYGPNESGKSTLRMFLTYVFFGLKADERERYRSKLDGQLGGRVVLEEDGEEWTFERFSHKQNGHRVVYKQGEVSNEDRVKQLLKGLDRFLLESIFSFQDRDLQTIRQYQTDDIGKLLFNIGLTGSERISELESKLDNHSDDLFKKQGKKPELNQKLTELKQLDTRISEANEREHEHHTLYQEVTGLEKQIEQLKVDEQQLLQDIRHHEKLLQSKSSIVNYQLLQNKIQKLKFVYNFPRDGRKRFEELMEKRQSFDKEHNVLTSTIQNLENQLTDLKTKSQYENWSINLTECKELLNRVQRAQSNVEKLKKEQQQLTFEFNKIQDDLGLTFEAEEMKELSLGHYTKETWRRIANQWEDLQSKVSSLNKQYRAKQEELNQEEQQKEELQQQMLSETEEEKLQERLDDLRLSEQKELLKEQFRDQLRHQQNSLSHVKQFFNMAKVGIPVTLILAFIINGVFNGFTSGVSYGLGAFGLIVSIISIMLIQKQQQKLNNMSHGQEEANSYDEQQLMTVKQKLNKQKQDQNKLDEIVKRIYVIESNRSDIKTDLDHTKEQLSELEKQIDQEIEKFPFLSQYELYFWPNVHEQLLQGKSVSEQLIQKEIELDSQKEILHHDEQQLKELYTLYEPNTSSDQLDILSNVMQDRLEQEEKWQREIEQKQQWIEDYHQELKQIKAAQEPYEQSLNQLYRQASVDNENEFRRQLQHYEEYLNLNEQLDQTYQLIYEIFQEKTDQILKKSYDWDELEAWLSDKQNQQSTTEQTLENHRQKLSEKRAQIKNLEEDGILSDLVHERSQLEEEIYELAKKWAVSKTAQGFIRDTKYRYQNVYLPDIMEQTKKYFDKLTDGHYQNLSFTQDETILVQHVNGDWFNLNQLSEGTADQLYISLRFALNDSLKRLINVPFILDDAFVHFDENRKEQVLDQLRRLSHDQQMLYFTCYEKDLEHLEGEMLQLNVS